MVAPRSMAKPIDSAELTVTTSPRAFVGEVACGDAISEALTFLADVYRRDLGAVPTEEPCSDEVYMLVRGHRGAVVASCRLLGPAARPFDFEDAVCLAKLEPPPTSPALVGRLCVHPDFRNASLSLPIHRSLAITMIEYAQSSGVTDLLLYTYANLVNFYRMGGFSDTHITFHHRFWGDVRLMRRRIV